MRVLFILLQVCASSQILLRQILTYNIAENLRRIQRHHHDHRPAVQLEVEKILRLLYRTKSPLSDMLKFLRETLAGKSEDDDKEEEDVDYGNAPVTVHKLTNDPTVAWKVLRPQQHYRRLEPMPLDTPVDPDKVRFVCVSDTHNQIHRMSHPIPDGDVFLHAGDITQMGKLQKLMRFNDFLANLPHKHKIVIAGNHDLVLHQQMLSDGESDDILVSQGLSEKTKLEEAGLNRARDLFTNCMYLEDEETTVYGLKVYGSPWQPEFCDWAFNLPRGQPCLDKWNLIPTDIDVLITHGPPIGHGDLCKYGHRAGCVELLHTIQQRVKPKFHVFGHIHEDPGVTTDGVTTYINASTCNLMYRPDNPPIIFDLPLPPGKTKADY